MDDLPSYFQLWYILIMVRKSDFNYTQHTLSVQLFTDRYAIIGVFSIMFVKRNAAVWLLSLSITSQAAGMNAPLEKKMLSGFQVTIMSYLMI